MAIWTWNPVDKAANVVLSNGNLKATSNTSGWVGVRGVSSFLSGKWYWEYNITAGNTENIVGIGTSSAPLTYPGNDANGYGFGNGGYKYYNNSPAGYGISYTNGDIVGVAYDTVAGKIWWSVNNTWYGSPSAGTGEAYSGITGTFFPQVGMYANGNAIQAVFYGSDLTYTPPTAFSAPEFDLFIFNGYVQVYGVPAAREVYLYRRSDGQIVDSVTSNSGTGYFELGSPYDEYHFVVILPELADDFNLLSYDKIHPSV